TPAGLRIAFDARQGRFRPWWSRIAIVVHGWQGAATVSGLGVSAAQLDTATGTIRFDLTDRAKAGELVIARR
ncbi:hypothetical protein, partial [Clostridium perfringens]